MCFNRTLAALSVGCLERRSFAGPAVSPVALPIYLLCVPWLLHRFRLMEARLSALGAPDVTLVWCANREDIEGLSHESVACLHPYYVETSWSRRPTGEYFNAAPDARSGALQLLNGTLSLALKHRIAYRDALARRLPAALVLEDDATVPPTLWAALSTYQLPRDAEVFYCGSYSMRSNTATLQGSPRVNGTTGPAVHQRVPLVGMPILGASAYIIFARGAATMLRQPVLAEADISLSLLAPTSMCGDHSPECPLVAPSRQYGPALWLVGQDSAGGGGTHRLNSWSREKMTPHVTPFPLH